MPCDYYDNYTNAWGTAYTVDCYTLPHFSVYVGTNDSLWGIGGHTILSDTIAEISAIAYPGYHFAAWNDSITDNPRIIRLAQDTTFEAIFAKNVHTLIFESDSADMGVVDPATASGEYLDSTSLIYASPSPHHHFVRWSDGNTDNPRRFVFDTNRTHTAIFAIDVHTVQVQADDVVHGSVDGDGSRNYGQPITVSAAAYSGYQFAHWSDGSTYNPYTFAVVEDKLLTAIFIADGEPWHDTVVVYDTIYLPLLVHDTIYLHDTIYITTEGVDEAEMVAVRLYQRGGQLVVEGAAGERVALYDAVGRLLTTRRDKGTPLLFDIPASGTYLVRVGDRAARRIVVVR